MQSAVEVLLQKYGQTHLLREKRSQKLDEELLSLDWKRVEEALQLLKNPSHNTAPCHPLQLTMEPTLAHPAPFLLNHPLGCLVMAGGQATRLNGLLPKGLIPVTRYSQKPTLQLIAEKVLACSTCYKVPCYLGIMTSEGTHEAIVSFFSSHKFFGLKESEVFFFKQSLLPAIGEDGLLVMKNGALFMVPDGNGGIFKAFEPLLSLWEKAGISLISVINSDNPLIDPFLPNLLQPLSLGAEMTAAAVERASPEESVGLFVREGKSVCVREYSEIDPKIASARDAQGDLSFKWANISFLACTLDACKKASHNHLPLHLAKKTLNGFSFWKAEQFIFDHFPLVTTFEVLPISRDFFAPIKSLTGPFSPEGVGKALEERDKRWFRKIYNKAPPSHLELAEEAYYHSCR